jgi:hypothetical protein
MKKRAHRIGAAASLLTILAVSPALAWNSAGHRAVTRLALDGLKPDLPSWIHEAETSARIAEESCEPDRWRGLKMPAIGHEANPEHYIDAEDLEQYGLSLSGLPKYRYDYVKTMVAAKIQHPERLRPYDAAADKEHSKEWPGFLPWAIQEHYEKLASSFNTLRILEGLNDPARAAALAQARENVIHEMGILSHFVGDGAQPLHMTRHHHGWVGDNPQQYTTDFGFHAYIDGTVLQIHGLTYETLKDKVKFDLTVPPRDPWPTSLEYLGRSFSQVEPLYRMQKDGSLEQAAGKAEIEGRLCDAASMLAALYNAAWEAGKPTDSQARDFVKFSEMPAKSDEPAKK